MPFYGSDILSKDYLTSEQYKKNSENRKPDRQPWSFGAVALKSRAFHGE
jgi:hypothetical protein